MKMEIRNWVGVVILLCLGFVLGRVTFLPEVSATPQESEIGRYQLVLGDIDLGYSFFQKGAIDTAWTLRSGPTLFRIDTKSGEVERRQEVRCFMEDTVTVWEHRWVKLTGVEYMENR